MAKSRKSIVAGKSIQDILNIDNYVFNRLSAFDLRQYVSRLASAANKRLRRLENNRANTPAYRQVMRSGGNFSTRGKNLNELRAEFVRAKNFLEAKSSTVSGWKKTVKGTIDKLHEKGVDITPDEFDQLWSVYEELKELDPSVSYRRLKYAVLQEIEMYIEDNEEDAKSMATRITKELGRIYEEQAERDADNGGVSSFFEL